MIALVAAAYAVDLSESRLGLSAGVERVINDEFLNRTGLHQGVTWQLTPWVELGGAATWYPILGHGGLDDPDWTGLSKQLLRENSVSPDLSKLWLQVQLTGRVRAFRAPLGHGWEASVGLLAGAGVFATQDDLVALQTDGPEAIATQDQVHPGAVYGLFADVSTRRFGVRLRSEQDSYIEVTTSDRLEMRHEGVLALEALCWF